MLISSQCIYFIKLLRDHRLCGEHLDTILRAHYFLPKLHPVCLGWFITNEKCGRLNAFIKSSMKYGITQKCFNINEILCKADCTLFKAMLLSSSCVCSVLQLTKCSLGNFRARGHNF